MWQEPSTDEGNNAKLYFCKPPTDANPVKTPYGTHSESEAVLWWMSNLTFSGRHDRQRQWQNGKRTNIHHFQCTFEELAISLEIEKGVALAGPKASMDTKASTLAKMMRYIVWVYQGRILDDSEATSFAAIFHPIMSGVRDVPVGRKST